VPHLPGSDMSQWSDGKPTATLCATYSAWLSMLQAAKAIGTTVEPFRYDLVNLGREVLAQLSTPASQRFAGESVYVCVFTCFRRSLRVYMYVCAFVFIYLFMHACMCEWMCLFIHVLVSLFIFISFFSFVFFN
jgi:hypothetical protein